jgi:hypothetical protein
MTRFLIAVLSLLPFTAWRADAQAMSRVRPPARPTCETMPTVGRTIGELCSATDTGLLQYWDGAAWTTIGSSSGAGIPQLADIIISDLDGTNAKAVVVRGGQLLLQDTDAGDVLQMAVDYLDTNGGLIWVKGGRYRVSTTVQLKNNNNDTLSIVGEGPDTVFELDGTINTFIKPYLDTSGSTQTLCRNVTLSNFDLDANEADTCGYGAVLFGNIFGGCGGPDGAGKTYASFEDININNINVFNIKEGTASAGIVIGSRHYDVDGNGTAVEAIASPFSTHQTDIWIDRVHIDGGDYGFILGDCGCCNQACSNRGDRIFITNSSHVRQNVPTNWEAGTNLYLGGISDLGTVLVDNFYGENSGDDCIELNQPDWGMIHNSTCRNAAIHTIVLRNDRNMSVAAGAKAVLPHYFVRNMHVIQDGPIDFSYDPDGTGATYTWQQDPLRGAGITTGCDVDNRPELCGTWDIDGFTYDLIKYTGTFPLGYGGHTTTSQGTKAFVTFNYGGNVSLKNVIVNAETDFSTSDDNFPGFGQDSVIPATYGNLVLFNIGSANGFYTGGVGPKYDAFNVENVLVNWNADITRDDTGKFVAFQVMDVTSNDMDLHMKNIHSRIKHSGMSGMGVNGVVRGINFGSVTDYALDGTATEDDNQLQGTITNVVTDLEGDATTKQGLYFNVPAAIRTKKIFASGILGRNGAEAITGATAESLGGVFRDTNILLSVGGGTGTSGDPYTGWTGAAEAGGTINFPCGYFLAAGQLDLASGTTLIGSGDCTVIRSSTSPNMVIRALLVDDIQIKNLKIDGQKATRTDNYDVINFNGVERGLIEDVSIIDGPLSGIQVIGDGTNDDTYVKIRNVRVSNVEGQCVKFYNASRNEVDRLWCDAIDAGSGADLILDGDGTNGGSDFNIIHDSYFDGDGSNTGVYIGYTYHTDNKIYGNHFVDLYVGVRDDGDRTLVHDNYFNGTDLYTILRNAGSDFTYANNTSRDTVAGIVLDDNGGRIRRGAVLGNHIYCTGAGYGIQLASTNGSGMDEIGLEGNVIECNTGGGQCIYIGAAANASTLWTDGNLCVAGTVTACPANWSCAGASNP